MRIFSCPSSEKNFYRLSLITINVFGGVRVRVRVCILFDLRKRRRKKKYNKTFRWNRTLIWHTEIKVTKYRTRITRIVFFFALSSMRKKNKNLCIRLKIVYCSYWIRSFFIIFSLCLIVISYNYLSSIIFYFVRLCVIYKKIEEETEKKERKEEKSWNNYCSTVTVHNKSKRLQIFVIISTRIYYTVIMFEIVWRLSKCCTFFSIQWKSEQFVCEMI